MAWRFGVADSLESDWRRWLKVCNGCRLCSHFDSDPSYHTYPCTTGVMADEAIELLRQFYVRGNAKAPKPQRVVQTQHVPVSSSGAPESSPGDAPTAMKRQRVEE